MHWHILGAGSIGCLWAAHLAKAGHQVTLLVRTEQRIAAFNQRVTLEHNTEISHYPVQCQLADNPEPINRLLVTTKAYDVQHALSSVQSRLCTNAQLVLLHNGMGPQQWAAQQFSQQQVWAATSTDGAWLRQTGHVVYAGQGETRIGQLNSAQGQSITGQLQHLTLQITADPDIEQSLWRKLAINCAINPLTAIHNCRNGELVSNPAYKAEMAELCAEIDTVLQALELPLFSDGLLPVALQVAQTTAKNYSSMLQDVRHQRRTEIDYITGYLCQQATSTGQMVEKNEQLLHKLKKIC